MTRTYDRILSHAETSEKSIEAYLVRRVAELGGHALKYSNQNEAGYPDRLVLLPGGAVVWVELKSKGEKPRKLQLLRHAELEELGQVVVVADSKKVIDEMLEAWKE